LGFHGSFYAFDLFCIALFFLAAVQLKPYLPQLARTRWHAVTTLLSVLSLQQVLLPMVGGQNTTITLSLLTLAYCAHRGGRPVVLGLCLGLLSYKPQYLLLLLPFLALRREWVATGVAGGVVALHYLGGALVCGWDWPHRMLNAIAIFSPSERASMGHFSLPRISEMLFDPPMQTAATVAGCALVVAVIVRALRRREGAPPALSPTWALLLCGSLLVSPHLNYYDAGVMVLPILLLVDHRMGTESRPLARGERLWLLFLWGVYPAWELAEHLHVQPLFFVLVAVFVWAERALRWGGPVPAARPIAAPSPAPATDPG
jgi:arabinofuranan 3-O-arabinosyltransferase